MILTLAEKGELHPFNTRKHASIFYGAGRCPTPLPQHCWEFFHTQDLTWCLCLMKSVTKIALASTVKTDPLPHQQEVPSCCCWIGAWNTGNANTNIEGENHPYPLWVLPELSYCMMPWERQALWAEWKTLIPSLCFKRSWLGTCCKQLQLGWVEKRLIWKHHPSLEKKIAAESRHAYGHSQEQVNKCKESRYFLAVAAVEHLCCSEFWVEMIKMAAELPGSANIHLVTNGITKKRTEVISLKK